MTTSTTVKVWDLHTRVFHWSLVSFFALIWLTAESLNIIHQWTGYAIGMLIAFRIFWGFAGNFYARFNSFVFSPRTTINYLKSLRQGNAKRYLGHNPAGAAMIFALLTWLSIMILTGMSLAATDGSGPLAQTTVANWNHRLIKEVHEVAANLMLFLVFAHVTGVVLSSRLHGENLVKAMVNGKKQAQLSEKKHE